MQVRDVLLHPLPSATLATALGHPALLLQMNSPDLIKAYEHCNRDGYWARDFEHYKIDGTEMLQRALRTGLTSDRKDFGEHAGESCYGMGVEPGLQTKQLDIHSEVCHLACLSDVLCTAIRKPQESPWLIPDPIALPNGPTWHPSVYMDPTGTYLRRIALVSSWNDDRHFYECRAWNSLGEICAFGMPMQLVICVIGSNRSGRRHSYWSHGLRHPVSRKLRFRKRTDKSIPFKDSWTECWREDYDEISTKEWLQAMHEDGVLADSCFVVDIPVPDQPARDKIVELASKRLEQIYKLKTLPPQQLSTCDWPAPCQFRSNCHKDEQPSGRYGFVPVESLTNT